MGFFEFLGSIGVAPSVPASWSDEYRVINRFFEYMLDKTQLPYNVVNKRWNSGYYSTPIPPDQRVAWIRTHRQYLHHGTIMKGAECYNYKYTDIYPVD